MRLFLLGSAMGMLLYRRGDLPLHANAVVVDGKAWAFFGASGSGKSTLAAWYQRRGHRLLADDVTVIRPNIGDVPYIVPGVPRLRLWEDAALREGHDPKQLMPSFPGDPDYRKYDVSVAVSGHSALPLAALCLLDHGERWSLEPLTGVAAVEALFAHSYRGQHVGTLGDAERHWRSCVQLAQEVPMFRYRRTLDVGRMDAENQQAAEAIEEAMRRRLP